MGWVLSGGSTSEGACLPRSLYQGHPKHTSCYHVLHRGRPPATAIWCHPKIRWASAWGQSIVWCIPLSLQSHQTGCRLLCTVAEGAKSCLKPTQVLMHMYSPTDLCKVISLWGICTPARVARQPHGHRDCAGETWQSIPSTRGAGVRHQVSQATQMKESAYFSHHSVNVLLSVGTNFQWQSFTFFTPRDFW